MNRGEIFIWNHSKNNNASSSYSDRSLLSLFLCLLCLDALRILSSSLSRAAPNKTKRNPVIFCLRRPMIPSDMMASLSVPHRSLAVAARVYHRAYKSVHEDQIGFQKYKIHSDIKKEKGDEGKERKRRKKDKEEGRGKKIKRNARERTCRRTRNAL